MVTTNTVQTITASKTFSDTIEASDIIPVDITNTIGDNDHPWSTIHLSGTTSGEPDGKIYFGASTTAGTYDTYVSGSFATGIKLNAAAAKVIPARNNTIDLGDSSNKWKDLYLAGNLTDGTNSIAIANIANKASIPDAVSGTNDGTNWTTITIGSVTKNIPSGGGSGGVSDVKVDNVSVVTSGVANLSSET